jgi:putative holliday junction resolvase
MNSLAIDFGSKHIGLAYSVDGFISTLPAIKNDHRIIYLLKIIIKDYSIAQIFVGLSEGEMAEKTKRFVKFLNEKIEIPIETVEEAVSTIEADSIFKNNQKNAKRYKQTIDSIAAAVILRRALGL